MKNSKWVVSIIIFLCLELLSCSGGGGGGGGGGSDTENKSPVISGTPDSSVISNQTYLFSPTASDPEGNELTFSITNQPSWTSFDKTTGTLTGIPSDNDVGNHQNILIEVSDGALTAGLAQFTLTVTLSSEDEQSFSFIILGDMNGGGCDRNDRVNRLVQRIEQNEGEASFYISTGDIIDGYWNGNGETACFASDPALVDSNAACGDGIPNGNMSEILSPLKNRPPVQGLNSSFFMALGNHDDNWGSGWYPDPCNQGICDFLDPITPGDFINHPYDEENICSINQNDSSFPGNFYYSFTYNNSYFIVLKQNNDSAGMLSCNGQSNCEDYCSDPDLYDDPDRKNACYNIEQFDWLRAELEKANTDNYDHIFVFSHAPLVTSSDNHSATSGNTQIRALLEDAGVDIYFNGHNHAYERTYPLAGDEKNDNGTTYITAGSSGALTDGVNEAWFTASSSNDFAQYGESGYADKMTTYLKITVNTTRVDGKLYSLGLGENAVDTFTIGQNSNPPESASPTIEGCEIFPSDNMWNTPVDTLDLHTKSDNYITSIGSDTTLHPDFGTEWNGNDIGIPYTIIPDDQPFVDVSFLYADETDPLDVNGSVKAYPIPDNPLIEGGSDHHVLLLMKNSGMLYELFAVEKSAGGDWSAGSGAIWDLSRNEIRPEGVTSADAAGLAILPGLIRYEEVFGDPENSIEPGIHHAIRITLNQIQSGYIKPASHSDGRSGHIENYPPMGLRLRLKADYDMSGFDEPMKVILTAMKKYGIVIADTGSDMFISGVHDDRWDDSQLRQLKSITASDFEAVYTGPVIDY